MAKLRRKFAKIPFFGGVLVFLYRLNRGFTYFKTPLANFSKWLIFSRETTNLTYDLEEMNKEYLASIIADVLSRDFEEVMSYINEIEEDKGLKKHIEESTKSSEWAFMADREVRFGRRVGWYAFVRLMKPKVIIETGVDKGLGSCVLTAALMRNHKEGHEGQYYGTDINPNAGYLLSGEYSNYGCILYGDSVETLGNFNKTIDLFISDSDHSAAYEAQEYEIIASKLSDSAIILGDNANLTNELLKFSQKYARNFLCFQEKPKNHWYLGEGMGISFGRQIKSC